jgi:hypothetical protein
LPLVKPGGLVMDLAAGAGRTAVVSGMSNAAEKLMSLKEFLAWEREQPERYEYACGVITMMTGGSLVSVLGDSTSITTTG